MSDTETGGQYVSHVLRQDRTTRGTSDTGKPVRRTRTKTCSKQQDTDKSKGKSKTISAILTHKPKTSTDIPLVILISGQVSDVKTTLHHYQRYWQDKTEAVRQ